MTDQDGPQRLLAHSEVVRSRLAEAVEAGRHGAHDQAEAGFLSVLALDPGHAEAQLGLGLTYMATRRFTEAVKPLTEAARAPSAASSWHACLAQGLYLTGDFRGSDRAFGEAARLQPLGQEAHATWRFARCLAAMVEGDAGQALDRHATETGADVNALLILAEEASVILGVFGRQRAAAAAARWRLAHGGHDPVTTFRLAALEGAAADRAPPDFIEAHFDAFADRFDHQLVSMLGYTLPRDLAALVGAGGGRFERVLDLGCGTGLALRGLALLADAVVGVDLSGGMLAQARARGGYQDLVQADAVAFMNENAARFDLIFAADLLIYFGDLAPVFQAAARALRPGGRFAFSTERGETDWVLLGSGRFAHADAYVERLAPPAFRREAAASTVLRQEGLRSVEGALHLFVRL